MTVERNHKPGGTGRQRQHPPPAGTTIMPGENSTPAGHSDREKPLFEQDRHIREWVGTSTAITERLEDELRASEQRFWITFEQAAVGLAHVALDGRWLLVNRKLCDIVGYTREELLERTFHSVMLPEDLPEAFAHAQRLITGELETFVQEMRHVRKDGSLIWVNLTVTLVRDTTGMPLYFLAVTEDRTDRKQAEQQRQMNQLKDQFIVNVNHELRTPLTEVYGYLQLLSDYQGQLDAETQATFFRQAKDGCEELILLVNNVLDALAVTEEMQPPPSEELFVAPLVGDVLDHLDPRKEQADRLSLEIPEQLTVWANGQLLRQVIRNLLSNAFKYCPKPASVIISAALSDPAAQGNDQAPQVLISVQDTGPGIPPTELPLLFQKFVRLKRDLSGPLRGSGLGLYISKRFVEAMQGRIWGESAGIAGQGSRFCLTLPCPLSPP
jgi:PAS domain S-box-containing protein